MLEHFVNGMVKMPALMEAMMVRESEDVVLEVRPVPPLRALIPPCTQLGPSHNC